MSDLIKRLENWAVWCHEQNLKAELQRDLNTAADKIAELTDVLSRCNTATDLYHAERRIAELEARLDAVRYCKWYVCEFPDIGKIGAAYRKRDVDAALEQNDD